VRAQHEGRLSDACEWYRVSVESAENTTLRSLAMYRLGDWAAVRKGISQLDNATAPNRQHVDRP
jgi:hypothetical protein